MKTKVFTKDLEKVYTGLIKAADAVISTMGPEGQVVIITDDSNNLKFTKDGVSVARSFRLEDPSENIGAQILISSAHKTVKSVGDGTTSTALFLKGLIELHSAFVPASIPKYLSELESGIKELTTSLQKKAKKVTRFGDVHNIAKTASNSTELGKLFLELYEQVGFDSLVKLERSEFSDKTYFDVIKGIEYESGYVHPAFMTNKLDETVVYENPYIHIDPQPVSVMSDEYERLLDLSYTSQTPVVIIAPRFSDAFIRNCVMNKVQKALPVVLIQSPGYGNGVNKNYDDIRAFLNNAGGVDKIVVTSHTFTLYNEDSPNLNQRIEQLRTLAQTAQEEYDQRDYNERIHKLKQSSAIIYAGGRTIQERDEEFDRLEDALGSVSAAIRSGYIKGSGQTLFESKLKVTNDASQMLNKLIEYPKRQIFINAKKEYTDKEYDVKLNREVDFYKMGIIDPVEVVVESLNNAFASYKLLTNTSYIIHNELN